MLAALLSFLSPAWGPLIAIVGMIAAIAGIYFKGKSSGTQAAQSAQTQERLNAIEAKKQNDDKINNASPSDVDKQLAPWMRD